MADGKGSWQTIDHRPFCVQPFAISHQPSAISH
jgi:hypothetical protein